MSLPGVALNRAALQDPTRRMASQPMLLLVLVLAFVVRTWRFDGYPEGFAGHSIFHLRLASFFADVLFPRIVRGDLGALRQLAFTMLDRREGPFVFVNALAFYWFGPGLIQARIPQVFLGTITVGVAYAFGTELRGRRTGLLLAGLLAVSPWHISYSRYSDAEHIVAPLQFFLMGYLILLWKRRTGEWISLLVGMSVGLCWYVYAPNQIEPVVIGVYFVLLATFERESRRTTLRGMALILLGFVLVSYPNVLVRSKGGMFRVLRQAHSMEESNLYSRPTMEIVRMGYRELYVQTTDEWLDRPGGALGFLDGVLYPSGLVIALAWMRDERTRSRGLFLFLWFLAAPVPAVLGPSMPFRRLVLVGIMALVSAALALTLLTEHAVRLGKGRIVALGMIYIVLLAHLVNEVMAYFVRVKLPESEGHLFQLEAAREIATGYGRRSYYVCGLTPYHRDQILELLRLARRREYEDPLEDSRVAISPTRDFLALISTHGLDDGPFTIIAHPDCTDELFLGQELDRRLGSLEHGSVNRRNGHRALDWWRRESSSTGTVRLNVHQP
jgi:Dolichyl-phosphate-mannose-protein mannosyltransferase